MRTQIFSYHGIVGVKSDPKAEGIMNNPEDPSQLGYVLDARYVEISQEAFDILSTMKPGANSFASIDIFQDSHGCVILSFLGGPKVMIHPIEETSREYTPSLLDGVAKIVPNEPPEDFCAAVHEMEMDVAPYTLGSKMGL